METSSVVLPYRWVQTLPRELHATIAASSCSSCIVARGSLAELDGLIRLAIAVELSSADELESLDRQAEATARMLTRMIKALGAN